MGVLRLSLVRMNIHTIAVGGGVTPSMVVLCSQAAEGQEPIKLPSRFGMVEATAISLGLDSSLHNRPMTHDLLQSVIESLRAQVVSVQIVDVMGTTFFAQLVLLDAEGRRLEVDCRPSDAIALAVRTGAPILADERVLEAATLPDFSGVERMEKEQELERFHDFVESLSPEDFS